MAKINAANAALQLNECCKISEGSSGGYHRSRRLQDSFLLHLTNALSNRANDPLLNDECLQLTGTQAKDRIGKLATLLEKSSHEGSLVAIAVPHSAAQGLAILATLLSRRIPLIVNPWMDLSTLARFSFKNKISTIISNSDAPVPGLDVSRIRLNSQGEPEAVTPSSTADFGQLDQHTAETEEFPALVVLTSGSSGRPKPVAISFLALNYTINQIRERLKLDFNSVATIAMPLFHTLALNTQFLPTIIAGGRCVFSSAELQLNQLYRTIASSRGNYLALVADLLTLCHQEKSQKNVTANDQVKSVVLAGGMITRRHLEIAHELFPAAIIHKGYGLTEAIRISMISSDDPNFYGDNSGYPLPSQSIEIRSQNGKVLSVGEIGEIHVAGPNVSNSYLGIESILRQSDGFLATGDQGIHNADGTLTILGRGDRIFKSQGRKIAPLEIEKAVMNEMEITQAVCLPRGNERKGLQPVLFLELGESLEKGQVMDLATRIEKSLRIKLEPFKIPKEIVLCDSLPRLANNKPDVSKLKGFADFEAMPFSAFIKHRGIQFLWATDVTH